MTDEEKKLMFNVFLADAKEAEEETGRAEDSGKDG